jgi:SAM-dependent methyltransferase
MPTFDPEAGPKWDKRAGLDDLAAVLDPADVVGQKNALIDRVQRHRLRRRIGPSQTSVLDVGCGNGRLTIWLGELGRSTVGVDPSVPMVIAAKHRRPAVSVAAADGVALPFRAGSFELAISVGVLQYAVATAAAAAVLLEVRRATVPGGGLLALEQAHDGGLDRGASRRHYVDALRDAGYVVERVEPVRVSDSTIARAALRLPWAVPTAALASALAAEARLRGRTARNGRYVDTLFVCRRG